MNLLFEFFMLIEYSVFAVTRGGLYMAWIDLRTCGLQACRIISTCDEDTYPHVVALFLTRELAKVCAHAKNLRTADLRWESCTAATIQTTRVICPAFPLADIHDMRVMDVEKWFHIVPY